MTVGAVLDATGAGRDLVAGDVAIGAGWGTVATKAIKAGSNRTRGRIDVTASTTGPAQATATVTVTFPEPYDEIPFAVVARDVEGEAANGDTITKGVYVKSVSKTTLVLQADTIPVDTKILGFSYLVCS